MIIKKQKPGLPKKELEARAKIISEMHLTKDKQKQLDTLIKSSKITYRSVLHAYRYKTAALEAYGEALKALREAFRVLTDSVKASAEALRGLSEVLRIR